MPKFAKIKSEYYNATIQHSITASLFYCSQEIDFQGSCTSNSRSVVIVPTKFYVGRATKTEQSFTSFVKQKKGRSKSYLLS